MIVRTMPPGSLEQVVYRMDALWRLESAGVVVLNPPKALECAVDKYLALVRLESAGLTVPATIVCENAEAALVAFDHLGGDVVVKPIFGSEGRGIVRVSDRDLALRTFRTLERIGAVLYVQRFIENEGFDVRVLVLGGRILGAHAAAGKRRLPRERFVPGNCGRVSSDRRRMPNAALGAAEATGARFAGVDLLYDRDGTCYVIEVNAVPGWRAFQRVTRSRRGGRGDFEFAIVGQQEISMDVNALTAALSRHMPDVLRWSGALARQLRQAQYRRLGQALGKRRHGRLDARRSERAGADRGRSAGSRSAISPVPHRGGRDDRRPGPVCERGRPRSGDRSDRRHEAIPRPDRQRLLRDAPPARSRDGPLFARLYPRIGPEGTWVEVRDGQVFCGPDDPSRPAVDVLRAMTAVDARTLPDSKKIYCDRFSTARPRPDPRRHVRRPGRIHVGYDGRLHLRLAIAGPARRRR